MSSTTKISHADRPMKRKPDAEPGDATLAAKKARMSDAASDSIQSTEQITTAAPTTFPTLPHAELMAQLQGKYEVKIFSILSSTSMQKRLDAILQHLGRFHPWDLTILPGVVLLFAKAPAANKLISIAETVRRRVHEADQKWYQYNRLFEQEVELVCSPPTAAADASVVEDTVLAGTRSHGRAGGEASEDADDDDEFETMPAVFEQAVNPPKIKRVVYLSTFLSRVPVPELAAKPYLTMQTNEEQINYLRRKRNGLA